MSIRSRSPRVVASLVILLGAVAIAPATASAAPPTPPPVEKVLKGGAKPSTVTAQGGVSASATTKKATGVSAGYAHNCAVTTKGAAICWGYNPSGQLGDNTTTSRLEPVGVYGLTSKVKSVTSGYAHSCALTTKGKVLCWGDNSAGQLGDNTTTNSKIPVEVYGMTKGIKAVSAGYTHTCALTTKGKVRCWGNNNNGQLGDNSTTTGSPKPVTVYGLTKGAKAISAGYYHTCAIAAKGKAKCWGNNSLGQLGDNSTSGSPKPVTVYGLTKGVKAISTSYFHTCAVSSKGAAKCWGSNSNGELGDNSTTSSPKPVTVYGLTKSVKSVKPGLYHTCAVTTKAKAKCWGYNVAGQLGDNSTTSSLKPVAVYNPGKVSRISAGYLHTCVLTTAKAVKCWGDNAVGQLGNGTTTDSLSAIKVLGF